MNILKDSKVKQFISSLGGLSYVQYTVPTACQCIEENTSMEILQVAHSDTVAPFSSNMAQLAASKGLIEFINLATLYISKTSYFNGDTMQYLINGMLECKDVVIVEKYRNILGRNLRLHPPCAQYMETEYEQLLLGSYKYNFNKITLWDYIIECLNDITNGSLLYGENKVYDLAFKSCLDFCICVLKIEFEVSKKKKVKSLVAKCLKYKIERKTRLSKITKLLDMVFKTGYNIQVPVINFAILVSQLKCN